MNLIMYGLQAPKDYNLQSTLLNHKLYTKQKKLFLVPNKLDDTTINPKNFLKLKRKMKIKETLLIDKTIPENKRLCIANHVNRSGYNFLIGRTPIANLPRFPDMSKIYNEISGLESAVVHTVGPERFRLRHESNNVTSESVGLIAPVWQKRHT